MDLLQAAVAAPGCDHGDARRKYATVQEVGEEAELLKPEIWVSDLISLEEEEPLEPLSFDVEVVMEVKEGPAMGEDSSGGGEKTAAGGGDSAVPRMAESHRGGDLCTNGDSSRVLRGSAFEPSPEITVHFISENDPAESESAVDMAAAEIGGAGGGEAGGNISDPDRSARLTMLRERFELEVGATTCKLTRALSETRKVPRGGRSSVQPPKDLPASLHHLHLENVRMGTAGALASRKVRKWPLHYGISRHKIILIKLAFLALPFSTYNRHFYSDF